MSGKAAQSFTEVVFTRTTPETKKKLKKLVAKEQQKAGDGRTVSEAEVVRKLIEAAV